MNDRNPGPELSIGALGFLLIVALTLFPYEFQPLARQSGDLPVDHFGPLTWHHDPVDWLLNILLFMPFGFGMVSLFSYFGWPSSWRRGLALGASFILTTIIEFLQIYLPRLPSYSDLLANMIGALLGIIIFEKHGRQLIDALSRFTSDVAQMRYRRLLVIALIGYLGFLTGLFLISRNLTSLRNWNDSYHLVLGNEHTANRPWRGVIHVLRVAEWDLSRQDVAELLADQDTPAGDHFPWLSTNDFNDPKEWSDSGEYIPELTWRGNADDPVISTEGVFLSGSQWLESREPARRLVQALKASNHFSLHAVVASLDTAQYGPARIVSISQNPYQRNFTLGQDARDLIVRLRTPFTGENGMRPELVVPDVFLGSEKLNLVVTYDGATLDIFINDIARHHRLELRYAAALCWGIFPFDERDLRGYKTVCHGLVAIPLAVSGLLIFSRRPGGNRRKWPL